MKEANKARHLWAFCLPVLSVLYFYSAAHPKFYGDINLKTLIENTLADIYVNQEGF